MAVFYQVAGTQLALPDYARVDLAYPWTYYGGTRPVGQKWNVVVSSGALEIPLSGFFSLVTSAAVSTRVPTFIVFNAEGLNVAVGSATTGQGAGAHIYYGLVAGPGFSYSTVGANSEFWIPPVVCNLGWTMQFGAGTFDPTDQIQDALLTVVRIPAGPPITATTRLTATPLLT